MGGLWNLLFGIWVLIVGNQHKNVFILSLHQITFASEFLQHGVVAVQLLEVGTGLYDLLLVPRFLLLHFGKQLLVFDRGEQVETVEEGNPRHQTDRAEHVAVLQGLGYSIEQISHSMQSTGLFAHRTTQPSAYCTTRC